MKAKGKLRKQNEVANLVSLVTLGIKEEFKNLRLSEHKLNNDLLLFIMNDVEDKCETCLSKKTRKAIDKNELVILIYKEIFDDNQVSDQDIANINANMEFIIDSKLIKVTNWMVRKGVNFFCALVK
jgi:hypothetical protein